MNNNLTELIYIIDMSGSMHGLEKDTIGGYNSLLEQQRKASRDNPALKANITTVFFDDEYVIIHDRADLSVVNDITDKEYQPRGCTAMLDAIGKTVVSVGQKLAAMPEEERPSLVSVTIITDGYENASKEYTWERVRNMIKEQREKYSWLFSFIGANIDVEKTTYDLGIDRSLATSYTASTEGTYSVYNTVSDSIVTARGMMASGSITVADVAATLTASYADIK